jgi:REP element-mobilizing transposase RayT
MKRYRIIEENYPYFVTGSVVKWLPIFVTPSICDILIDSLRYCRDIRGLLIHAYVIMPTHYHMIVSCEKNLSGIIRDFKRFTSGQIAKAFDNIENPPFSNVFRYCGKNNRPPTEHKVWQDGSHPELIKTEPFFKRKLNYLHENPLRKKLVTDPLTWTYSSIRYYAETGDGPIEVTGLEW